MNKSKEFVSNLKGEDLINYYNCYWHHHQYRYNCHSGDIPNIALESTHLCPCKCAKSTNDNHFCTTNSCHSCSNECTSQSSHCFLNQNNSIVVCENYAPSYTSKRYKIN